MMKKTKNIQYTIGVYLAEYIISNCIPSLSYDQSTKIIIPINWGESKILKLLEDKWYSSYRTDSSYRTENNKWNDLLKYRFFLKEKYLPHTLKCTVPYIDFSDETVNKQIMKGFIDAMWNWDFCDYSLKEEDIIFENETIEKGKSEINFTHVTLKLDLDYSSYLK